jgi:cytochrome c553
MGKNMLRILALLASGASLAHAQGNPSAGKEKAETCAGCHGEDGNSGTPIFPKFAGQHASYIAKQLHDFKSQKRPNPTMSAISETLEDADIDDLSAFYAGQKGTVEKTAPNALGEKIYRTGNPATGVAACSACHDPNGNGNPAALFPALSGQYAAYVEKTLRDFKTGARTNDLNGMMRVVAVKLSDEEITAVADFVSGLK